MKRILFPAIILAAAFLLVACGASTPSPDAAAPAAPAGEANDTRGTEAAVPDLIYQLVELEVESFDHWREVHSSMSAVQEEHGLSDHLIARGEHDGSVVLTLVWEDVDGMAAYFDRDDVKAAMGSAGLTKPPSIRVLRTTTAPMDGEVSQLIELDVKDFDAWAAVHASMAAVQAEHGLQAHIISRNADDDSSVILYLFWANAAGMNGYFDSQAVKDAMASAGLTGPPKVTVLQAI